MQFSWISWYGIFIYSGVARAFPGGRVAQPEGQNEYKNEDSLSKEYEKNDGNLRKNVESGTLAHPGL